MPNRILREGILTSERVSILNWPEEVFYRRLMSVVDDFGRYHANPKLVRAALYPLLIDKVSDPDIGKWLTACVNAGLVTVYEARDEAAAQKGSPIGGKPAGGSGVPLKRYLQLLDFRQQARAEKSRFPDPSAIESQVPCECVADAMQPPADAPVFEGGDVVEDEPPSGVARGRARPSPSKPEGVSDQVWNDWLTLRRAKKAPVTATVVVDAIREAEKAGMTVEAFFAEWCSRGSQGLRADWIANGNGKAPINRQLAIEAENRRVGAEWLKMTGDQQ